MRPRHYYRPCGPSSRARRRCASRRRRPRPATCRGGAARALDEVPPSPAPRPGAARSVELRGRPRLILPGPVRELSRSSIFGGRAAALQRLQRRLYLRSVARDCNLLTPRARRPRSPKPGRPRLTSATSLLQFSAGVMVRCAAAAEPRARGTWSKASTRVIFGRARLPAARRRPFLRLLRRLGRRLLVRGLVVQGAPVGAAPGNACREAHPLNRIPGIPIEAAHSRVPGSRASSRASQALRVPQGPALEALRRHHREFGGLSGPAGGVPPTLRWRCGRRAPSTAAAPRRRSASSPRSAH